MTSRDAIRGVAVGVLAALVVATNAEAAMKVTKLTGAPASVVAGDSFAVKVTVTNAAKKKAKAGRVTFKLDRASVGALKVKALKARGKATVSGRLTVPAATAAGSYKLNACYGTKCATGSACRPRPNTTPIRRTRTIGSSPAFRPADPSSATECGSSARTSRRARARTRG